MSYRCGVCEGIVPNRTARKVHVIKRPNGSTYQEVPICATCEKMVADGMQLYQVRQLRAVPVEPPFPIPVPVMRQPQPKHVPVALPPVKLSGRSANAQPGLLSKLKRA